MPSTCRARQREANNHTGAGPLDTGGRSFQLSVTGRGRRRCGARLMQAGWHQCETACLACSEELFDNLST